MSNGTPIRILLIEDDDETIRRVTRLLGEAEGPRFRVSAVKGITEALAELSARDAFDLLLIELSLTTKGSGPSVDDIRKKESRVPIVFLGARKEVSLALEAMRIGGTDFLPKEDLDAHVFPQTLVRHVERYQLDRGVEALEIKRGRLEAMQGMVVNVSERISGPIDRMLATLTTLESRNRDERSAKYLKLIRENLERMAGKLDKIRNLKDDKTVKYIKDIKMIDIS